MSGGRGYCLFGTAFGTCGLAWSAAGLTRVQLPEADPAATEARLERILGGGAPAALSATAQAAIDRLARYFAGIPVTFDDLPLDMAGVGDFDTRVYRALREVRRGATTTYGALAAAVGEPGAARAVGRSMATNRWPVVIPCHRVLAAGNRMGGFSAYGAVLTKERLLAIEGASAAAQGRLPGL
jgi:methylated-DNA-[protein]-cysteine S-methyltransferase